MHTQLKNWELPDWLVYAGTPKERRGYARTPGDGKKRKAHSTGNTEDLPPAERAERLFRADLNLLASCLANLPALREQHRGELFVSHLWEEQDEGRFSGALPQGAGVIPWKGLSLWIAVHALMHESIEPMLDALHPDPSSVDREKLYVKETRTNKGVKKDGIIYNLKTYAAQLAKVVRGGKVRTGHLPGQVPAKELAAAWMIGPLEVQGFSDEEILDRIRDLHPSLYGDYTVEDIARIRKLDLQEPSE